MLKTRCALLIMVRGASSYVSPAAAATLSARQALLLTRNHYTVQPDGAVLSPGNTLVSATDLPYVLQNLESSQRLQALLQLDLLLNQNVSDLTTRALRQVARDNWAVLPQATRKDLKKYFNVEELEGLNSAIAEAPAPAPTQAMQDPEPLKEAAASSSTPVALPHPADASTAAITAFLDNAVYGRDAKVLVLLIAEKAPSQFRAPALEALTKGLPLITLDPNLLT